jgi:hypothetical protein
VAEPETTTEPEAKSNPEPEAKPQPKAAPSPAKRSGGWNLSVPQSKRYIVVATVGTGVLSTIAVYRRGDTPSPRLAAGVLASGVMLAVLAEVAPSLAGGFALLMLTTAVFVVGGDAWQGISNATSRTSSKVASGTSSRGNAPK